MTWTTIGTKRVMMQKVKKLADFNFKLLHKILPCGENLKKWKIQNSPKCRFSCDAVETYEHMFIKCPKLHSTYSKIAKMLKELQYDIHFNYKLLIFGYKISYPAYDTLNTVISHIFFAVYKYWLENDENKELAWWIKRELINWNQTYNITTQNMQILDNLLKIWP